MPDQPETWLGAALPDLAAMGRFRIDPKRLAAAPEGIRTGVAIHHASDAVFHSHQWFRSRNADGRRHLASAGIRRGPARAVAHVGPELLLDGALDPADARALLRSIDLLRTIVDTDVLSGLTMGSGDGWTDHLRTVVGHGLPIDNHDPIAVGGRLVRILHRRPRLALAEGDESIVISHLARIKPRIDASAGSLLDDLTSLVQTRL